MPRKELTAAASRYAERRLTRHATSTDRGWQLRAWELYHLVPEVRFASAYVANAMAGALLFAGRRAQDGTIEKAPDGHRATEIVTDIAGGPDGQSDLLKSFGKHLTVPGEGWIVIRPNKIAKNPEIPKDGHEWRVLSVREVTPQNGKLSAEIDGEPIEVPAGNPETLDPDAPVALRVWEQDPERAIEADSPVRSSLDLLEELLLLNAAVKAIARSRLTGRGILLVPKGTRFPTLPGQGGAEDDLIETLMTVAETAIRQPESAAATVPIILEVPAESISDFKLISFESNFDELALKLREEAIRRFACGLEMPAEILLGLGDLNHWGLWGLTAEAIRLAIEPRLATVCRALTQQWLRPILEAERVEDWDRWLVWYDSSPLRVRANRSETALQVHERGVISDEALRRETGFDDDDAPDAEEAARRTKKKEEAPTDDTEDTEEDTDEEETGTDLPVDETQETPDSMPASASTTDAGLLAATDGMIWAALAAAGRKLERTPACPRSERGRARQLPPAELHTILFVRPAEIDQHRLFDGAWTRVPEIAARYNVNGDCLTAALDEYCRDLLCNGVAHAFDQTAGVLRAPCLVAAA
ncbi:hypothetical protein [Streptomyces sp. AMCC400023]|uniref:hypothetical protein n=1 Tax=Streptomyces sp. AMCC400023 TaxID=2056258 RepID=UPI001F3000D5|nr:hypothetical protein [Streptomyces sp. AMCC400023]